jgi:AraC-like DNA-binding protein
MTTLIIEPGILAVKTQVLDTQPHQHVLQQLTLPLSTCQLSIFDSKDRSTLYLNNATVLQENQLHQLNMGSGWVLLIEPSSDLGQQVKRDLGGNKIKILPHKIKYSDPSTLSKLLNYFNYHYDNNHAHLDQRIQVLLNQLDLCFENTNLAPQYWSAKSIASQLHLSESRFLHLFKENMQLPLRPYLLWRRLICAIKALESGQNATQAAHIAGFSDSAHLSRTFKKQFGITLQKLTTLNRQ